MRQAAGRAGVKDIRSRIEILDQEDIERLHTATLEVLATVGPDKEIAEEGRLITATVDLSDEYRLRGLGHWWMMSRRERRTDIFDELGLPGVPMMPEAGGR